MITINALAGAAVGNYTLFDFYSGDGTGAMASGINSGNSSLSLAALPTNWTGSLVYTTNTIDLNITAIPEPATWVLLAATGTFIMVMHRRRMCM